MYEYSIEEEERYQNEQMGKYQHQIREWALKTVEILEPSEIIAESTILKYWEQWQQVAPETPPYADDKQGYPSLEAAQDRDKKAFRHAFCDSLLRRFNHHQRENKESITFMLNEQERAVVRYFGVYDQRWSVEHLLPNRELAAMHPYQRRLVMEFLGIE